MSSDDLVVTVELTLSADHLSWTAVRSSGPGGQNVNKVSTKVDLRFDLEASQALSAPVKARLRVLARGRLDGEGRVVVVSDRARSQARNLEDARERLCELIRLALEPPKRRHPTKPSRAARRRRLDAKRRQSKKKTTRSRVDPDD